MAELILIAVSLALDACAVSVSSGMAVPGFGPGQAVKLGCWFGGFQFLMPLAGWLLGRSISVWIAAVDHWVSFGLLALIGGRMIWEALGPERQDQGCAVLTARRLAALAVATSIDALAVGITFAFLQVDILPAVIFIGVTTFALSFAGVRMGSVFGSRYRSRAELAGGLVLIGMGLKILLEHTLFR